MEIMRTTKNKKYLKQSIFLTLSLLLLMTASLAFVKPVHAEQSTEQSQKGSIKRENPAISPKGESKQEGMGFAIEPVQPSTQLDTSKGYYYLGVKPGEKQTLTLRVRSTQKEPVTVKLYVKDAYTNGSGNIDYDGTSYKRDKTLKDSIEEITTVPVKEVTVKELETKELTIEVAPPQESFAGIKAGAICVMKKEAKKNKNGVSTEVGYRLGLVLTEKGGDYANSKTMKFLKVKPAVHLGKRTIQSTFQNPEPKMLTDLTISTTLRKKGSREVLRSRKTEGMRMAPNSQFDFSTVWGIDPIKPGTYQLTVKATSKEESWSWIKEFTISNSQAKKMNEEANYTITYPNWVPMVVLLLGILTLIIIGSLYVRRNNWSRK